MDVHETTKLRSCHRIIDGEMHPKAGGIETRRRQRSSSYYIASQPWAHALARSSEEFLRMKGHCQLLAFASALILLPLAAYSQNPNAPGSQMMKTQDQSQGADQKQNEQAG